jgi:hypothetical protein
LGKMFGHVKTDNRKFYIAVSFRSILKFLSLTKVGVECEYVLEIDLEDSSPLFKMIEQFPDGFSV